MGERWTFSDREIAGMLRRSTHWLVALTIVVGGGILPAVLILRAPDDGAGSRGGAVHAAAPGRPLHHDRERRRPRRCLHPAERTLSGGGFAAWPESGCWLGQARAIDNSSHGPIARERPLHG